MLFSAAIYTVCFDFASSMKIVKQHDTVNDLQNNANLQL